MKKIIQYKPKESVQSGRSKFTTNFSPSQAFFNQPDSEDKVKPFSWLRFAATTICLMAAWLILSVVFWQKMSYLALPLGLLCGLIFRKHVHQIAIAVAEGILFFMASGMTVFIIASLFLIKKLSMTIPEMISGFGFWSFTEAVFDQIIVMDWIYMVGAGILTGIISGSKLFLETKVNKYNIKKITKPEKHFW